MRLGAPPRIVATSLDAYQGADHEAHGVPAQPIFFVRFDRILATSSDYRPNFTIRSGAFSNVVFREIRVDPVAREVVFSISTPLPPARYVLHVESGPDDTTALAAVDGVRFQGSVDFPFWVDGPAGAGTTELQPDASGDDACDASRILARSCAGTRCHGRADGTTAPAMGLNLATDSAIQETAVAQAAVEVAFAASPSGAGQPGASVFPFGLPRIRPGQSSASYLIYKMLKAKLDGPASEATPPAFALADIADPNAQAIADLQLVPGAPMPHDALGPEDGAFPRSGLGWGELRLLRRWIDTGARPCSR